MKKKTMYVSILLAIIADIVDTIFFDSSIINSTYLIRNIFTFFTTEINTYNMDGWEISISLIYLIFLICLFIVFLLYSIINLKNKKISICYIYISLSYLFYFLVYSCEPNVVINILERVIFGIIPLILILYNMSNLMVENKLTVIKIIGFIILALLSTMGILRMSGLGIVKIIATVMLFINIYNLNKDDCINDLNEREKYNKKLYINNIVFLIIILLYIFINIGSKITVYISAQNVIDKITEDTINNELNY